jgi:D-alanyl-D-alanine carboxypeptidase
MGAAAACEALLSERVGQRGAAALAFRSASQAWEGSVGVPRDGPAPPRFLAYSITKSFLATLVLQLRDEGRLSLEDPLARWSPELAGADAIRVRQLLRHTAGLPDYGALPAYVRAVQEHPERPWDFETFAAHTFAKGPAAPPGARFAYSNPGYALLRRIVERETGASLREALAARIAGPLGLAATEVVEELADQADLVPAPTRLGRSAGEPVDARLHYHPGWVWHGVLASTPGDLCAFYAALFGGRLVSAASVAEMTELVPVEYPWPPGEPGYGLGLMGSRRRRWFGHNGGGPGYTASAWCVPDAPGGALAACAMCAFEDPPLAEALALATLDLARAAGTVGAPEERG